MKYHNQLGKVVEQHTKADALDAQALDAYLLYQQRSLTWHLNQYHRLLQAAEYHRKLEHAFELD